MADRQFVACKFRTGDTRTYTYHWDGEPFAEGDQVKVPDKAGDGWQRVTVVSTTRDVPKFPTKAVLGLAPPVDADPITHPDAAGEKVNGGLAKGGGLFDG